LQIHPSQPNESNPLAAIGRVWTSKVVVPMRAKPNADPVFGLVGPALIIAAAGTGTLLYRATAGISEMALRSPKLYRFLHQPWLGPIAGIATGYATSLGVPMYMAETRILRPETWPDIGTLTAPYATSIAGFGIVSMAAAAVVWSRRIGRDHKSVEDYADAHWAKWSDVAISPGWTWIVPIKVHYKGTRKHWVRNAGRTVLAPQDTDTHRHILLVGQTGSGKGFCVFSPVIASSKVPIVYQDVKGQCPGIDILRERLNIEPLRWGAAAQDGWSSMRWNPLEESRKDPNPAAAFEALAAALIPGRGNDDWVAQLARPILAWVFQHGGYETLAAVQDVLVQEGVERIIGKAGVPQGLLAALEGKNVKEYLGTTIFSAMSCFRDGWGREVTSGHDFSLEDVCSQGCYVLSAEPEVTQRTPLVLFWRLLLRKLLRSTKPVPLNLLFDEALAAGKIPSVRDALATLRDREVSIVFGTQHLSGLKEVYGPAEGESLIASFSARVFLLSGLDPRDRKFLVDNLGNFTKTDKGKNGSPDRHTALPLLQLDELNRRANQTQYIKIKGKAKITKSPVFWAIIDGPGFTRRGEPICARMEGYGGSNLIRRPTVDEVNEEAEKPLELQPPVTPSPEALALIEAQAQPEDLVHCGPGPIAQRIFGAHPELNETWMATGGQLPRWAWDEANPKPSLVVADGGPELHPAYEETERW